MALAVLPEQLTADSPLWAWAYDAISHRGEGMLEHLEGVRLGEDIEAVHDMRVGSRRLVAAMRVFRQCFPGPEYRLLLREARRVTSRLGQVRDLDVLIDHYQRLRPEATPGEHVGIDYFIAIQGLERRKVRRPMLVAMSELEKSDFPARLRKFLRHEAEAYSVGLGPPTGAAAGGVNCGGGFRTAAPVVLEERYHAFYAFEPYVHQADAVEELHEMRIAAKWLRYTMELFAPAYGDELKRTLATVKKFQELLGDLHDSDIRREILKAMLDAPLDARGLEAVKLLTPDPVTESLRRLQAREERERRGCYKAFYKEWKRQETDDFAAACLKRIRRPDA